MSNYDIDGSSTSKDGKEKTPLREIVRQEIVSYLRDPIAYEEEFKGWLPEWITQVGIDLPISQVVGFTQFTAQTATIATAETTTSTSYTDLATVGPQIPELPDGLYVVFFGAKISQGVATESRMGVKVNSDEATDAEAISTGITSAMSLSRAIAVTLGNGGNNTLTARYKYGGVSSNITFSNRWLTALRVSNA